VALGGCADEEAEARETAIAGSLDGDELSFPTAAYGISLHQATPIDRRIELRFSADACGSSFPPAMPYLSLVIATDASGTVEVRGRVLQSMDAEAEPIDADGTLALDLAEVTGIPDQYTEAPFVGVGGALAGTLDLELGIFDSNGLELDTPDLRGQLEGPFFAEHCLELDDTHFE
jgi:hypothetical protein